jgi:CheY-like chemotaxis protein
MRFSAAESGTPESLFLVLPLYNKRFPGGWMRKKLLVVEDERIDALRVGQAIKQHSPNVSLEVVTNGEQALDWIQRYRPDPNEVVVLVLMDLSMPRMSGFDLISQFKANMHLRTVPIVILSGNDSAQAIKTSYSSGACAYVVKPGTSAEMRDALKRTLDFWLETNQLAQA